MLRIISAVGLLLASPVAAVTFTSLPGAPDPGLAAGETLLVSFDAPMVAGVTSLSQGLVMTAAGSSGGVRAAPAGTSGVYQSIGGGGSSLFDFSGWSGGKALRSLSFYWGSIDTYNFVDFLDGNGVRVGGLSGSDLPVANGNQTAAMTNRRVYFNFLPSENVQSLRLRSDGNAFEYDSIGAGTAGAVPEPGTWLLMIIGFGLIGLSVRHRSAVRRMQMSA